MATFRKIMIVCLAFLLAACKGTEPNPSSKGGVDKMPKSSKRGVAFSFTQLTDLPLMSPYISWDYNWGNAPTDEAATWFDANEMDYCPMCWNGNYSVDKIRTYVAAHPNTKYLLAFNEPNLTDQANMTPAQAAALWAPVVALAKELNLKLVSPAMNYGTLAGYHDPVKWLDEFFSQPNVSIDDVYAISVHCYMSSVSAVKAFIEKFEKYNKPIWLTEFCAWDPVPGSVETQKDYMCAVLNYLETRPSVERYAWFIPRTSGKVDSAPYMQLLTHDYPAELTELGKMYCWFSPMDSTVWLKTSRPIFAGEYMRVSDTNITLRPSTDAVMNQTGEGLIVTNMTQGHALTYQLHLNEASSKITVRYCGYSNSICEVYVDGKSAQVLDLPSNSSSTEWVEAEGKLALQAGNHTVTLQLFSGNCNISGFTIR